MLSFRRTKAGCLYLDMAATDRALSQMFRSAILPLIQPQLELQAKKLVIEISMFKNSSCKAFLIFNF
jgi:hypothetical protein